MSIETVARRYGTALADVVLKTGETETVKSELKTWEEMTASNPDLQTAFGNPAIAHRDKERVLESLIQRANPSRTTANFLRVLLKNDRLTELVQINDKFASVLEERSGRVTAENTRRSAKHRSDSTPHRQTGRPSVRNQPVDHRRGRHSDRLDHLRRFRKNAVGES